MNELEALLHAGYRYAVALTGNEGDAEDLLQDAWLSMLRVEAPRTRRYLFRTLRNKYMSDALILAGGPDSLTFACAPEDAEKLVLSGDLGPMVPSFHVGQGQRHVTVPVDGTPIDAGLVDAGMHSDLLATTHEDGATKTTTFLTDVPIDQVHVDGRVTVRVSPKQAELLLHMVERGPISLSLRGR